MSEIDYGAVFGSSADGEAAAPAGEQSAQGDDKQEFTAPADQYNEEADRNGRQNQRQDREDKEQRAWRMLIEDKADKEQRDWRILTEDANDRKRKTANKAKDEKERQAKSPKEAAEPEQKAAAKQKKPPQSAEENAAYAAARRKAEAVVKESIAKGETAAVQRATQMLDRTISELAMKDPYSGKIIKTKAEYDAFRRRYNLDKQPGGKNQAGQQLNRLINAHPTVQKAEQAAKAYQQQVHQARVDAAHSHFDREIVEIGHLDPSIKSRKDLRAMDTYPQMVELFKRGNTLVDAFRLANMDSLTKNAAAAAARSAANKAAGKSHLTPTQSRGKGAQSVPSDVAKLYRLFNPEATNDEISRHYNKHYKG